jgi:hypothetical protein
LFVDSVVLIFFDSFCFGTLRCTWTTQAPTFGPSMPSNGCTANSNPTVTSKSVETTINWTVGLPIRHHVRKVLSRI